MSTGRAGVRVAVDIARSPDKQRRFADAVREIVGPLDDLTFSFSGDRTPIGDLVGDAHVLVAAAVTPETIDRAVALEWVHLIVAGVETSLCPRLVARDIQVTNVRGMHAVHMAEHALALMLAFSRRLHECMRGQAARQWRQRDVIKRNATLAGKRLGIVGLGSIGAALAKRASALGMEVWGLCRDPASRSALPPPPGVARLMGPAELDALLGASDYVAVLLPLTPGTRRMIDTQRLARMKPSAVLINLGRGQVVDEDALAAAVAEGRLAGAGLDVFEKEPLNRDSKLWTLDEVIVTPHSSGNYPEYVREATAIFADNLKRFLAGEPLTHVVDKQLGY